MSIDEAIRHAEEVAEINEEGSKAWTRDGWQSAFKNLTPEKEAELKAERVLLADNCTKCAEEHRQLAEWLKELKTLREKRPHGTWIPCSERLPEKHGYYLATTHYAIPPYHMFHPENDIYVDDISIQRFDGKFIDSVLAWMPLPEPYKKGGDRNE